MLVLTAPQAIILFQVQLVQPNANSASLVTLMTLQLPMVIACLKASDQLSMTGCVLNSVMITQQAPCLYLPTSKYLADNVAEVSLWMKVLENAITALMVSSSQWTFTKQARSLLPSVMLVLLVKQPLKYWRCKNSKKFLTCLSTTVAQQTQARRAIWNADWYMAGELMNSSCFL